MNVKTKTKPDEELNMSAVEFDEAMRKAFGVPPPKQTKGALPMRVAKEKPKPPKRK